MGILLALGSAVCYGLADFAGGLVSRRLHYAIVAMLGQLGGFVATVVAALALGAPAVHGSDLGWGAASGVGTGVGMLFLYRAISRSAMSVAVPVSAVTGVALPVVIGVVVIGNRPSALVWVGIAAGLPALWMVSAGRQGGAGARTGIPLAALIAGVGIALQYLALAYPAAAAGLWPLAAGRAAATLGIAPLAVRRLSAVSRARRTAGREGRDGQQDVVQRLVGLSLVIGILPALALTLYTLATREQLLTTAVVLSSLYPVIPVLLGIAILHERLARVQAVGLLAAAVATVLITLG